MMNNITKWPRYVKAMYVLLWSYTILIVQEPFMFHYGRIYSFGNWRSWTIICMAEANLILSQICSAQNGLVHVWRGWKKADVQMLY